VLGANLAQAQFRPIDPVVAPINPIVAPLNLTPLEPMHVAPLPDYVGPAPQPLVHVAPIPAGPASSSGDGPNGPPPISMGQAFVIAVCANTSDVSDSCLEQSAAQAAERLSQIYLRQWANKVITTNLAIRFPNVMARVDQYRFLTKIEKVAVAAVAAKMQADVDSLKPFAWDSEATKAAKWEAVRNDRTAASNWQQSATSSAESGSNWSHNWSSNTHTFHEGTAFRQLKQINLSGSWGGN
jgi:hypothetical protein